MKKVTRKVKQALSILLVAAMVITMVPQTALSVSAEESVEATAIEETVDTTVESAADETMPDAGTVDETEDSAEDEDADTEESEEEEADVDTDETDTEDAVDEKTEETEDEKSEEGLKKEAFGYEVMTDGNKHDVTIANDLNDYAEVTFTKGYTDGKAEEGSDLTFTVTPADDYKVTKVEYTVGGTEGTQTITDTDGVYTVPGDKITGDVTITVTTTPVLTNTVKFTYDENELDVQQVVTVDDKESLQAIKDKSLTVDQNADFSFAVAAKAESKYKPTDAVIQDAEGANVTSTTTTKTFDEVSYTVYTVSAKEKNINVNINQELDPDRANVLTFAVNGLKDSYTATVAGDASNTYKTGSTFLTAEDTAYVTITNATGYKVDEVKVGSTTLEPLTEEQSAGHVGAYKVEFTSRELTLTVTTTVEASGEDKTVVFAQDADHMTVSGIKVDGNDAVKADGKQNTYTIPSGSKVLGFTVTASGSYQPVVMLGGKALEPEKGKTASGKTPFTYAVAVKDIEAGAVISITEDRADRQISVIYDEGSVDVTASVAGKALAAKEDFEEGTAFAVKDGDAVKVTVTAKDSYKILSAKTSVGTGEKTEKTAATTFTYTVTATGDATTVIKTEALVEVVVSDATAALVPVKGIYNGQVGTAYKAELKIGGAVAALSEVKFDSEVSSKVVMAEDSKSATITPDKADVNKTLKLILTSGEGEEAVTRNVSMKVTPVATSVKVEGVTDGKLYQSADTTKNYKITITPKTASKTLQAEVTEGSGNVDANVVGDVLTITNKTTEASDEAVATIKLYDTATSTIEQKSYVEGGEITVYSKEPALKNATPKVALKDASDTTLTLTLSSTGIEDVNTGKVYYKVVVTPDEKNKAGEECPDSIKNAVQDPFYIERSGNSRDADITVNTAAPGCTWNFNVAVSLVQTQDKAEPGESNVAFTSKEVKSNKPYATKTPSYATTIGIKKLTTKIYTGQSNVEVAQVTFDKNATYKDFEITNSSELLSEGLTVEKFGDKIKVSAKKLNESDIQKGKYTINVKAKDADSTMKVASTSFQIEVVNGIEEMSVKAPATVYKADGKAASLTATVIYNMDKASWAPQTKKVEWSIVSDNENLEKNVTVKNGKVTVNKSYVLASDPEDNTFKVKVEAKDYEGNTTVGLSDEIEITGTAAQLGEVVIVNRAGIVIARSGDTVSADKLDGAYVGVLKKGAVEKDQYTNADYATAEVVFSSNNKKVLDINAETGKITVLKTGKNLKITATATDGSKAKAELKNLTVGYTEAEELGLEIKQENFGISSMFDGSAACKIGDEDSYKENDVEAIAYYGAVDTTFQINLKQFDASSGKWNDVRGIADYKLKVVGAKTVYSENGYCVIIAQKNPVTITLTQNASDKAKKKDKTYVLKNLALNTTVSLSAKTRGTLYGGAYPQAQQVTCTLSSKGYDFKDKYALVTLNTADAANQKNMERNLAFIFCAPSVGGYIPVNDDGTIDLCFRLEIPGGPPIPDYTVIPVGSYKLNISVGTVNADGKFVADTKTATVTLKAVAQKAVSSKLNAKYTMSTKAGAEAPLTLSNKQTYLTSASLLNANIKGQQNAFKEYFEITGNAEDGFTLKLKDDLDQDQLDWITGKEGKNDLTGWVAYKYFDGTYSYKGETQVTVSFKDAKYSLSKTTVLREAETATVSLYAGKEKANASTHVLVEGTDFTYNGSAGSKIVLNIPDASKLKKSNKVTLYVVPADSNAVSILDGLKTADNETKTDYENAIKAYGVKLTTTVSVVDKASTTKRISIASKDLTKTFTAKELDVDYEVVDKKGYYIVEVPYTNIVESIDEFTVDAVNDADKAMLKVTVDQENKKLVVKLDKAALAENVKNTGTTGVVYGQSRSVEFTLTVAEKVATQKITLNLTLPKEATANYTSVTQAVEEALKDVNTGVYYGGNTGDAVNDNILYIEGLIRDLVPADSDTRLDVVSATPPWDPYVTLPTSGNTGSLSISVQLTDLTQDDVNTIKRLDLTLAAL